MTEDLAYIEKLKKKIEDLKEENTSQLSMYEMTTLHLKKVQDKLRASEEELRETNKYLLDSINYARFIQNAFMISEEILRTHLPESFMMLKPKDIVSGDFVWLKETENGIFLAVGDCTGHGVPGAMLSVFIISMLNQITTETSNNNPAEILCLLDNKMQEYLSQYSNKAKSSAEIGMIKYEQDNKRLTFSGAKRALLHISNGKEHVYKGNRFVPGDTFRRSDLLKNQIIPISKRDSVYMYSDGFPDQFGGKNNKRYLSKRLRKFLSVISEEPAKIQAEKAEKEFSNWRGNNEQTDDVVLVGIKF